MRNITMTFNQIAAAGLAIILIGVLVFAKGNSTEVTHSLEAGLGLCLYYLFGSTSGSQAKDNKANDTTKDLIQQLGQSQPMQQTKN